VVREVPVVQRPTAASASTSPTSIWSPGKHLLYFFQFPGRPATLRAFASLANTPRSRIEVRVPPRRLRAPIDDLGQRTGTFIQFSNSKSCTPHGHGLACALAAADVNVRLGGRLWTFRADDIGRYGGLINHAARLLRHAVLAGGRLVLGGGWQESCRPSPSGSAFTPTDPRPSIEVPAHHRGPRHRPQRRRS
jgi:hypothetical protein